MKLKRTHSILELGDILCRQAIDLELSEDDCEFLDSVYLPSKYPLGSDVSWYIFMGDVDLHIKPAPFYPNLDMSDSLYFILFRKQNSYHSLK